VEVTVVELAGQILGRATDAPVAEMVRRLMESQGVRILTGCSVAELSPDKGGAFTAALSNGTTVAADAFILAIGVRPRVELAQAAGLTVNRGMVVDQHMRTSQPDIYACGDAAEAYDYIAGGPRLTPIWPNAYLQGRYAGLNMAGAKKTFRGGIPMNSIEFYGIPTVSMGISNPPSKGYEIRSVHVPEKNVYRKIVLRGHRLAGAVLVGQIERSGILTGLMINQTEVEGFEDELLKEDMGFTRMPADLRKKIMAEAG